jgi:hypothetical protein
MGGREKKAGRARETYAGAQGEMPAEAHACCADAAGAGGQGEQVIDCFAGIFVVGLEGLRRRRGWVSRVVSEETGKKGGLALVIFHSLPLSVPGTS